MDKLQLYKFVEGNGIEYHKSHNDENDVILFVNIPLIEEWNKMLGSIMDEEGINCVMKDGYFCFFMEYICEYFDIEMDEIFDLKNLD